MKFKTILCLLLSISLNEKSFGQIKDTGIGFNEQSKSISRLDPNVSSLPTENSSHKNVRWNEITEIDANMRPSADFFDAIWQGNIEQVEKLLKLQKGKHLNTGRSNTKWTPLHWAAHLGNVKLVELLLSHGANIEAKSNVLETPFLLAAKKGHINIINILHEKGANTNAINLDGETALILATKKRHLSAMKRLIDLGIDSKHLAVPKRHGASLTGSGWSALHWAAYSEIVDAIHLLIEKGVDPNIMTAEKETPLHEAVFAKKIKSIEALMNKGADPHLKNIDGSSPMDWAIEPRERKLLKQLLLERSCYN